MSLVFSRLKTRRLFFLLSALGLMSLSSCGTTAAPPGGQALKGITTFAGGTFEASGVAHVTGADGVLFVDNGREGQVFWMGLDQSGRQVGAIKPVGLGVGIEDIEGVTTDGTYFYVVSSQSRPKAIAKEGLVRFRFDASGPSVEAVESISGLKK